MIELRWHDLATEPPEGEDCIILFPVISDIGILYVASNPEYARKNALKDGYTQWFPIPKNEGEHDVLSKINDMYGINRVNGKEA